MNAYRVKIGQNVFLQADRNGEVFLLLNDVLYGSSDELVRLQSAAGKRAERRKTLARAFAMECLVHEYGPNKKHWPEIAQSFVASSKLPDAEPSSLSRDLPECP